MTLPEFRARLQPCRRIAIIQQSGAQRTPRCHTKAAERRVSVEVRFYIDPETGEAHIFEHDVTEDEAVDEAVEVLRRPGEDRAGNEGSRVAIGQTAAGRYLKVIYVRDPDSLFVITAYDLTGKALRAYRRRQRRRGK